MSKLVFSTLMLLSATSFGAMKPPLVVVSNPDDIQKDEPVYIPHDKDPCNPRTFQGYEFTGREVIRVGFQTALPQTTEATGIAVWNISYVVDHYRDKRLDCIRDNDEDGILIEGTEKNVTISSFMIWRTSDNDVMITAARPISAVVLRKQQLFRNPELDKYWQYMAHDLNISQRESELRKCVKKGAKVVLAAAGAIASCLSGPNPACVIGALSFGAVLDDFHEDCIKKPDPPQQPQNPSSSGPAGGPGGSMGKEPPAVMLPTPGRSVWDGDCTSYGDYSYWQDEGTMVIVGTSSRIPCW